MLAINLRRVLLVLLFSIPAVSVLAFESGSTGADGVFNPNVDTELALPPDGVFNFTEINVPAGVTVTFAPNALNTPVTLLVSGDAVIDGVIDVSGQHASPSVGAGDGNVGDDGLPGVGGPGGFPGGRGGQASADSSDGGPRAAQSGLGPGGGIASVTDLNRTNCLGSGGSFGSEGRVTSSCAPNPVAETYGNPDLLPLVGGSGGSGGHGGEGSTGSGGGGGGGALLLAVTGTLSLNGQILADGGNGGDLGHTWNSTQFGRVGGGGSGGGIRLVATTIDGVGQVRARGGSTGDFTDWQPNNGDGGVGRIRIEAETLLFAEPTEPAFTSALPGELFIAGMPAIRIASVAGQPAPAEPTGTADIVLPSDTPNPVEVVIETTNVPLGNTLTLTLTPPGGEPVSVISSALSGTPDNASATAMIDLPDGNSVLLATLSFSVADPQMQMALARYTGGDPVLFVELAANLHGRSQTRLHTRSGTIVTLEAPAG